jgi:hypothetical protein
MPDGLYQPALARFDQRQLAFDLGAAVETLCLTRPQPGQFLVNSALGDSVIERLL